MTKDDGDDHNSRVPNKIDRLMFSSVIPANSNQVYLSLHSYNVQLPVLVVCGIMASIIQPRDDFTDDFFLSARYVRREYVILCLIC